MPKHTKSVGEVGYDSRCQHKSSRNQNEGAKSLTTTYLHKIEINYANTCSVF